MTAFPDQIFLEYARNNTIILTSSIFKISKMRKKSQEEVRKRNEVRWETIQTYMKLSLKKANVLFSARRRQKV